MVRVTARPAGAACGASWPWACVFGGAPGADVSVTPWALADRSAPKAKPANAAFFRNRLRPDCLEFIVSSPRLRWPKGLNRPSHSVQQNYRRVNRHMTFSLQE